MRGLDWLDDHHLRHFWTVAREGSLVATGKVLRLSHPTLSAQMHALEDQLVEELFVRDHQLQRRARRRQDG